MQKTTFLFLIFFSANVMSIGKPIWRPDKDQDIFTTMQAKAQTNYKDCVGIIGIVGALYSVQALLDNYIEENLSSRRKKIILGLFAGSLAAILYGLKR